MTSSYYPYEDEWEEEWPAAVFNEPINHGSTFPVELAVILATLLVAAVLGWGALGLIKQSSETVVVSPVIATQNMNETPIEQPIASPIYDPSAIIAPYEVYVVTQGVHGLSYGHMAVDIAAGKGEPIKSPISGVVSESFIDAIGNPTLVIENERYVVTLLHGIYSVELGDQVELGDKLGVESNIGNTRDMQGFSCRNRDCGYHAHLNVFDKEAGTNINPLDLFGQ